MPKNKADPTDLIHVRESPIKGMGVFALCAIRKGRLVAEYTGALRKWSSYEDDDDYVCLFHVDDDHVIDPREGGGIARFVNHSCEPNCEAVQKGRRIFLKTLRAIRPGEELLYDYGLVFDRKPTKKEMKRYACLCGAPSCRGTMLNPDA